MESLDIGFVAPERFDWTADYGFHDGRDSLRTPSPTHFSLELSEAIYQDEINVFLKKFFGFSLPLGFTGLKKMRKIEEHLLWTQYNDSIINWRDNHQVVRPKLTNQIIHPKASGKLSCRRSQSLSNKTKATLRPQGILKHKHQHHQPHSNEIERTSAWLPMMLTKWAYSGRNGNVGASITQLVV